MYKVASNGRQRALDYGKWSDWVTWDDKQSLGEQIRNLSAAVHQIDEAFRKGDVGEPARTEMIKQKTAIQLAIGKTKRLAGKEKRINEGISAFICDVARERLMPGQYHEIRMEAVRRYDANKAQAEAERADLVDEANA